jgi:hypothetical protein
MHVPDQNPGKPRRIAAHVLTGIVAVFLLLDGVMKLVQPQVVIDTTLQLGYPQATITGMGVVLIASTLFYLAPRTSWLGAVLLTAYLGGAVASHVRIGSPWFSHTLFPVYVALLVWGALALRDARVLKLFGLRRGARTEHFSANHSADPA